MVTAPADTVTGGWVARSSLSRPTSTPHLGWVGVAGQPATGSCGCGWFGQEGRPGLVAMALSNAYCRRNLEDRHWPHGSHWRDCSRDPGLSLRLKRVGLTR